MKREEYPLFFDMETSVQISDGLTQTSADGANLVFDSKYGVMFCAYMPGPQGHYGESRGRISLTWFPASQPTNSRTVDIATGRSEYVPNVLSLGDGRVRVLYEIHSQEEGDHRTCYKDFDYRTGELSEEKTVFLKREDGSLCELNTSEQFAYLERQGYFCHNYCRTEQVNIGGCTLFRGEDGFVYGSITSVDAEPILYRSADDLATIEFFAVCPYPAQYEMDYKFQNGKIYAILRTAAEEDSVGTTHSEDGGKTWSPLRFYKESIQCRPRLICYNGHILTAYNYFNSDTAHRPEIQQGRSGVRICYGEADDPNQNLRLADLHTKYGIVNLCVIDILNDLYLAYSSSVLALEYQNGNPKVRGKDAIRYIKLGDLIPAES